MVHVGLTAELEEMRRKIEIDRGLNDVVPDGQSNLGLPKYPAVVSPKAVSSFSRAIYGTISDFNSSLYTHLAGKTSN